MLRYTCAEYQQDLHAAIATGDYDEAAAAYEHADSRADAAVVFLESEYWCAFLYPCCLAAHSLKLLFARGQQAGPKA